jgi:hypothetical protein
MKVPIASFFLWLVFFQCINGQDDAYQFVSNLYSHYPNDNSDFSAIDLKSIDTIFSPNFLDLLKLYEKQNQTGLGYDPVCDCQDHDGFNLGKINIFTIKGITFAGVKFKISDTYFDIKLKLIKKNKKWLIDDVISSRGSLYKSLKKNISAHK